MVRTFQFQGRFELRSFMPDSAAQQLSRLGSAQLHPRADQVYSRDQNYQKIRISR
jgi:hypothetical protein